MARQHPGKVVNSDNTLPVPQMPPNPSRIDRLIVEVLREHARVSYFFMFRCYRHTCPTLDLHLQLDLVGKGLTLLTIFIFLFCFSKSTCLKGKMVGAI